MTLFNDIDYTDIYNALQVLQNEFAKLDRMQILNASRVKTLRRMQAENHIYWQTAKAIADRTVAGNPIYDDLGQMAALVYQVTKNTSYANAAWNQLQNVMAKDGRAANDVKQRYVDYQLIYTWIKDSLTPSQIQVFKNNIQLWSNYCLGINQPQYTGSFRLNDSDQTVGQFFGLALQDALKIPPGNLLSQNMINLNTGKIGLPIGGLNATDADTSSARNTINWYVSVLASGGEWIESSQYNSNTVCLLITGWLAHWDATGENYFPELAKYIPDVCNAALLDWSPQLEQRILWGDNDATTSAGPNLYKMMPYLAALQFAANKINATDKASQINGLIQSLQTKYPEALSQAECHFFYYCDPYTPTLDTKPSYNYSPGVGIYRRVDQNKLFFGYSPSAINIDHEFNLIGDFRLWNDGEYVLSEPISYGGTGQANTSNSITVSGISTMLQQGYVNQVTTSDYTYLESLTAGPIYDNTMSWSPPPTWCNELRRRIFYLPTTNCIFVCDRINSDDPLVARPDLSGYTNTDAQRIKSSTHRHIIYWNCLTSPTLNENSFTYTTAGNQSIKLDYMPCSVGTVLQTTIYDEKIVWANYGIPTDQLMYNVQVNPAVDQQWDCIIWCVRLNPNDTDILTPVSANNGLCQGYQLNNDFAVWFSVDQNNNQLDPNLVANSTAKTNYLVGCSGSNIIVEK